MTTIMWFRQDLRIADNPALAAAHADGDVLPVYIYAPAEEGDWAPGAASRWWLHHSLASLSEDLRRCGAALWLRAADDSLSVLLELAHALGAQRVVWNRRYEPASLARDQKIKAALRDAGIVADSFNSALLHEPWIAKTKSGGPFQVFTPFWRHCLSLEDPGPLLAAPEHLESPAARPDGQSLASLALRPQLDWAAALEAAWIPGAAAAHAALDTFLHESFDGYDTLRDEPSVKGTSRLAPHLHLGEIGPRQVWHAVRDFALQRGRHTPWRDSRFLAEIGWREFAYHLLYHFPHTPTEPLRAAYARFPWRSDAKSLDAWQRGATGFPIVDAGLRELWHTGWMHNRVRMIVASFLIKDLLVNWTDGARWFWDTLVCADLASNTMGWQWVAGCGADAAPFFRIFNPVTQGSRFDPQGRYVRKWVPELARLSDEWIQRPWEASQQILSAAKIELGRDYPLPIIDHAVARKEAMKALAAVKT